MNRLQEKMVMGILIKAQREVNQIVDGYSIKLTINKPGIAELSTAYTEAQRDFFILCQSLGLEVTDVLSDKRTREFVDARQIFMHYTQDIYPALSTNKVGQIVGGKDHATVIHGRKKAANYIETDKEFRYKYNLFLKAMMKIKAGDEKKEDSKNKSLNK